MYNNIHMLPVKGWVNVGGFFVMLVVVLLGISTEIRVIRVGGLVGGLGGGGWLWG